MTENKPSGVPLAWAYECHNKYQKRGDYDERIDVDEWREGVSLFEPSGPRYRNIRPLWADPLGAAWMRERAAGLRDNIADQIGARPMSSIHSALCEYANAIRAIPDQTHADLLAQALKLPEVAALMGAAIYARSLLSPHNDHAAHGALGAALTALVQP